MTTRTYNVLDYDELDKLVNVNYPAKDHESIAENEWNNYSSYEFNGIDAGPCKYDLDNKSLVEFRATGTGRAHIALKALVVDGILPAGDYLVKVSW